MEKFIIMKANMKHRKGTFIGISVLMLIIILSLTVITSVLDNLQERSEKANIEADTGDFVVFISDSYANGPLQEKILENEYTERITDVETIAIGKGKIDGKELEGYFHVTDADKYEVLYQVLNDQQNGFVERPESLKAGEVYVPVCFRSKYDCKVGDQLTFETKQGIEQLTIKAFVEAPFIGASVIDVKQAFISSEDVMRLSKQLDDINSNQALYLLPYHLIHIFQKQPASMDIVDFKKSLNDDCQLINYSYATLSREESQEYTIMLPEIFGDILYVFVGLLFVIVLIVMGHSISTGIEMDYVNLGVLKSQGFTKGNLRKLLVLQYFIAQVFGAALGILLSLPLVRLLGGVFQDITGLLAKNQISIGKCILFMSVLLVSGAVFVYFKTAKIGIISPVKAISGGHGNIYFDHYGTVTIRKKWMTLRLSLRQITSGKRQYTGIILIVSILTYFLMSMTLLTAGIEVNTIFELFGGVTSDIEVKYSDSYKNEQKEEIIQEINEISMVTYTLNTTQRYVIINGDEYNSKVYDNPKEFKSILEGRVPLYENEILITELVSKTLGVGVGDIVPIAYQDKEEDYIVSGIYMTMVDAGKCIGFSLDGLQRIADIYPSSGFLRVEDVSKLDEIVTMLNEQFGNILQAKVSDNTKGLSHLVTVTLNVVTTFIYVISIFFTFVIVNMVCKKTFLKERQDIGIYKATGFTVMRLRLAFAIRFLLVSLLGCGLGIVLSIAFNAEMMSYLLSSCGINNFRAELTPITIIAPTTLVAVCFFLFSYVASRKIKSVAVKELIAE